MLRAKLEPMVQYKKSTKIYANENYREKELYCAINMKLCSGYIYI